MLGSVLVFGVSDMVSIGVWCQFYGQCWRWCLVSVLAPVLVSVLGSESVFGVSGRVSVSVGVSVNISVGIWCQGQCW